jgi:hypothetical protein
VNRGIIIETQQFRNSQAQHGTVILAAVSSFRGKNETRKAASCIMQVLPQIRAFESKGKLVIVNPQRRLGCAALIPEYSFTLDHRQAVEICDA